LLISLEEKRGPLCRGNKPRGKVGETRDDASPLATETEDLAQGEVFIKVALESHHLGCPDNRTSPCISHEKWNHVRKSCK